MTFISDTEHQARTRREQLENGGASGSELLRMQKQIDDLNFRTTSQPNVPNPTRQGINNMLRNTDHSHSVDTWFNASPSGTDEEKECANVYAYPPIEPIEVTDAEMTSGSPTLECNTSAPFTADMNGRYAIVEGAGASGAKLSGTITYVSPTEATMSVNAATTVTGANARINLQKFGHKNKKNASGDTVTDALKDASHTNIASNISDPDWQKSSGIARLGSTNVLAYPFGRFADNGTDYIALHQLFAGREPFVRLNLARASEHVKVKGKLFLAIYNDHESHLDWIRGADFTLTTRVDGAPATTVSTEYMVVIETDFGFRLVSEIVTVAGAPDDTAFSAGARVRLAWQYYAGSVRTTVYRKRSGGNVFRLESFSTGANTYADVNFSQRVDTGSASFPSFSDSEKSVPSRVATAAGELDDLAVDGVAEAWQKMEYRLPFSPSVNMAQVFDPHLVIGLTEPLATEVRDAVTNGTTTITSAAAQFTAAMVGKNFTLTKADGTESLTGTVASFVDSEEITLSSAPGWSSEDNILEIEDSQPNGLLIDLVGVSLNEGEWDFHPDDNSRPQTAAATPNGSTQGGTGGQPPTSTGGTGGVDCVLDSSVVKVRGKSNADIIEKRADEVLLTDRLWNGLGFSDADFNEIESISRKEVNEIRWLLLETKRLGCTRFHRVIRDELSFKRGIGVSALKRGENVLTVSANSTKLETVIALARERGRFTVISFELKKSNKRTAHLMVINDVVSHNRKLPLEAGVGAAIEQ